jgi:hypothetical protein
MDPVETSIFAGDFGRAIRLLDQSETDLPRTRQVCREALHVVQLDAEDFRALSKSSLLSAAVQKHLRLCDWPRERTGQQVSAMESLTPLYQLMFEIMMWKVDHHELDDLLALLHLMSDYLPILALQSGLGSAANPPRLHDSVLHPEAAWRGTEHPCGMDLRDRELYADIEKAASGRMRWREYLTNRHSKIGSALLVCAGTPRQVDAENSRAFCYARCAPMDKVLGNQALEWRAMLCRRLIESPLIQLRHHSPVGHFFAIPADREFEEAWGRTWNGLRRPVADTNPADHPLHGLPEQVPFLEGMRHLLAAVSGDLHFEATALIPALIDDALSVYRSES